MTKEWRRVYDLVARRVAPFVPGTLFFRGHADLDWPLLPGLARAAEQLDVGNDLPAFEADIEFKFKTRAGALLPKNVSGWDRLFAMQHHGLPTRLLDWSRSFAVALYFALQKPNRACAVWILDPYELNKSSIGDPAVIDIDELPGTYEDCYLRRAKERIGEVVAIAPPADYPRILHQRAAFTLHDNLARPLEALYPKTLTKVVIPLTARRDAERFLKVAGISEFTLFPDLDGLAREIRTDYGL